LQVSILLINPLFALFQLLFHHTMKGFSGQDRASALIVGNARCLLDISGFPSFDQTGLPDKRPTHGDIIRVPFIHESIGQLK
jgi:hypothetical protein